MPRIEVFFAIVMLVLASLPGCATQKDMAPSEADGASDSPMLTGGAAGSGPAGDGPNAPSDDTANGGEAGKGGVAGSLGAAGGVAAGSSGGAGEDREDGKAGVGGVAAGSGAAVAEGGAGSIGAAGIDGSAGSIGAAGAGDVALPTPMPEYLPSPNNPAECPAVAPENPVGDCLGLPVYLVCEYGDDSYWYVCTCDWYHWLCAGT